MSARNPPGWRIDYLRGHGPRGAKRIALPIGDHPLEVQIFGIRKNAETRKALRFFAERRIKTHFVDLMEKPASPGELRRFAQKFGVTAMIDKDSRRMGELGLQYARMSDIQWLTKLAEEPLLLKLPLVRNGNQVMVGADEAIWKTWMASDS